MPPVVSIEIFSFTESFFERSGEIASSVSPRLTWWMLDAAIAPAGFAAGAVWVSATDARFGMISRWPGCSRRGPW